MKLLLYFYVFVSAKPTIIKEQTFVLIQPTQMNIQVIGVGHFTVVWPMQSLCYRGIWLVASVSGPRKKLTFL